MLSVSQLLWLLLSFVVLTRYFKVIWASKSLPPGPVPFPFIGNLWTLGFKLHPQILTKLTESYGNIYTIWLGETPLVVLNGCKAVKDGIVSHSDVLSGRPVASLLKDLHRGRGIVMSNGDTWKQQRRFGMMTLRNLGLGNGALESQIQEEARCMVEQFRAKKGEPFDPSYILNHAVANIISALVYGHRFSIEDVTFQELTNCTHCIVENISSSWARSQNKEASTFDEDNLIAVVIDLFGAGTETTAIALLWGLLYMVAYPDIQQEVQKELDATSNGPQIYYKDRKNLPYTNAVIHEILRYGNIAAVGMPRTCTKNIKIRNYSLRKDTMVLANLDSVLYDPQYWKTPNQFNPQNFLDSDGNFLMNEAFMPFSAGSRVCLGEQLARSEVFNFFSTLMRSFSFQLPEGVTEVNTKYIYKLTLQPHPFRICAVPR
ncbi:cytochrome P450 2C14-like isoform X2 [Hyla sarda]|uniref:cytochrome P450 2C14-like isoform X2 n=1 Tax=Hyla sarda TaxID=327740 RepID=UPI0024C46C9F|nr:cytochrome P450 2C14-like isoform X2 [Hyla sarda]